MSNWIKPIFFGSHEQHGVSPRLLASADIAINEATSRVRFSVTDRERSQALIHLATAYVSNLWIFNSSERYGDMTLLRQIGEHTRQMQALLPTLTDPDAWEAAHNVRITGCVQRALQGVPMTSPASALRVQAFLVQQASARFLIPKFKNACARLYSALSALVLYERIAYRLKPSYLMALVTGLGLVFDAVDAGALRLDNHQQLAAEAVAHALNGERVTR